MMMEAGFCHPTYLQNPIVLELEGTKQQETVPPLAASSLLHQHPSPTLAFLASPQAHCQGTANTPLSTAAAFLPSSLPASLSSVCKSARRQEPAEPIRALQPSWVVNDPDAWPEKGEARGVFQLQGRPRAGPRSRGSQRESFQCGLWIFG